ncbi:MAG: hypothetical protein Kow0098_08830 [Ignavibacteriaceae bacterium]
MIKKLLLIFSLLPVLTLAQMIGPRITVDKTEYNFGDIKQGDIVNHTFILTNAGWDSLEIKDIRATCGCTAATTGKLKLAPGENTELKVSFNSAGRKGSQYKYVYITSNDPQTPQLRLTVLGTVLTNENKGPNPAIYFSETQHNFGKVPEGTIVDYTFNFKNNGEGTLQITDIKTSCGCTAALVSAETVEPGKEGTLRVELDTTNRLGKMSRTVTVYTNDPKEPYKVLTVYAEVIKENN